MKTLRGTRKPVGTFFSSWAVFNAGFGGESSLTTQILHQINKTERYHFFSLVPDLSSQSIHRKRAKQPQISKKDAGDAAAAKRASIQFEAGDIRGAMRFLCSDDASPSPDIRRVLLTKHPKQPLDRRANPVVSSNAMIATMTMSDKRSALLLKALLAVWMAFVLNLVRYDGRTCRGFSARRSQRLYRLRPSFSITDFIYAKS